MPEYDPPPPEEPEVDPEYEPSAELPPWLERRRRRRWPWVILVLLLICAAAFYWFYWRPRAEAPADSQLTERPAEPQTIPAPRIEEETLGGPAPPLDESDGWIREQARSLSNDPLMQRAVRGEDLARRVVVSVINAAEGVSPRRQFPALAPQEPFAPDTEGGRNFLGPTSYSRYNALARLVGSLNVDACVGAYKLARPLFTAAFREHGYPDATFDGMVRQALEQVESTPTPSEPIALERGVRSWRYVDPQLEALNPLQKQLLRMGPRNREIIQTKLQQIVARLDEE